MKKQLPKQFFAFFLFFLIGLFLCFSAQAKRNPFDDEDEDDFVPPPYLELAQQSLAQGDSNAAVRVLKSAKDCWAERFEKCGFTQTDFNSLAGAVYLEQGFAEKSAAALESVVSSQPNRLTAWFYLGQAYFRLSKYQKAADALIQAEPVGRALPQYHTLLVRAFMGAKKPEKARRALGIGLASFPKDPSLLFEATNLFISQGFFKTATDFAEQYAAVATDDPTLAFFITAEAYRAKGLLRDAVYVLEQAALTCGRRTETTERLAYAYAEANHPLAAAFLFEKLSYKNTDFAFVASEQFRLAGRYAQALRAAAHIPETQRRKEQLAAVYIQMESFDTAVEILLPLFKKGHLNERYALHLAFAALRAGRYDLADRALKTVRSPALKDSAAQLKTALARCMTGARRCR